MLGDPDRQALVETLRTLVSIPSRSTPAGGEEGAVQALVARRMLAAGARVRTLLVDDLPDARRHPLFHGPQRDYRDRPTVIGEIGPADAPAVLVLAHSDTVPLAQPERWRKDPFAAAMEGDRIYGLGVSDDKWGVAAMLTVLDALRRRGGGLRRRLIFASTIDEENGVANGTLLLHLAGVRAEAALYLDGHRMEIDVGCLGGSNLELTWTRSVPPDRDAHLKKLETAAARLSAARGSLFDRPYLRENAVRDRTVRAMLPRPGYPATLIVPFYTLPGEAPASIRAELEEMVREALGSDADGYAMSYREPWFEPALVQPREIPLIDDLIRSARRVLGRPPVVSTISKQDSFVLTNHVGIPTVAFGCTARVDMEPGGYHAPDEYLTLNELWAGARIAAEAIARQALAAPAATPA